MGAALSRMIGYEDPSKAITTAEGVTGRNANLGPSPVISKNAQKRLMREKRLQERKKQRKEQRKAMQAQKKQERKAEREALLKTLTDEQKQKLLKDRGDVMRAGRAEKRAKKEKVRSSLENHTRFSVCIDLGWNEHMIEKERKSLARQIAYSYSALRQGVEDGLTPLALSITGIDDVMKPVLTFSAQGWETWPVGLSEKSLAEYHDVSKLVYLTHDSNDVLQQLDPNDVYVIGGIVDRNRLKCATMNKAKMLGVRTARLNLDANISLQHGTPVLTVNHCVAILLYAANGMSWKDAYLKVLPVRKGIHASADGAASA